MGLQGVTESSSRRPTRVLVVVRNPDANEVAPGWLSRVQEDGDEVVVCAPRGVGETRWTRKNPPNYIERSHVLLGRTVDTGRVWDVIATARFLHALHKGKVPVHVVGQGGAGILAAYAALWEPEIAGVILDVAPLTHADASSPQFLNVLRVCDVPDVLGMLAPRPLTVCGTPGGQLEKVTRIYAAAGATQSFRVRAGKE